MQKMEQQSKLNKSDLETKDRKAYFFTQHELFLKGEVPDGGMSHR